MVNSTSPISSILKVSLDEENEKEVIKTRLKTMFRFDMFCEKLESEGVYFSEDKKFVVDQLGKKALFIDLEANYVLMKDSVLDYIEGQGYSYDQISGMLTNGEIASVEQTKMLMNGFFQNEEIMTVLNSKFKSHSIIEEVDFFEEVKSTIMLFMNLNSFIELLKDREKTSSAKDMYAKWRYLKGEVLQSLKLLGYNYDSKSGRFYYHLTEFTLDSICDLIKDHVLKDLIDSAQRLGYTFNTMTNLFEKGDAEVSAREVVIQINLNHIGLY